MNMHIDSSAPDDPIIIMTRTFDAPRALVWAVFTNPKHVANWYGGRGFSSPVCEMDVRPGGRWRHVMKMADGEVYPMEFVFVEVDEPNKLVWKNVDYDTRTAGPPAVMNTVTLADDGQKTEWRLVARFKTLAERDLSAKRGFTKVVTEGSEKLQEIIDSLTAGDSFTVRAMAVGTFAPMLGTLRDLLDKGAQKLDPSALVRARLAPDMFSLAKQVLVACHYALDATARLTGAEPPALEDKEVELDALRARIARTIEAVEGTPASAFEGAAEKDITMALGPDLEMKMTGARFLRDWSLPHFYFHVVTAYDILRHHGVSIGKRDYLAHVGDAIRPRG